MFCKKGVSEVFHIVFFGGVSQVLHKYFFKDLPRFSEHLFSRTALKCCLSSVIYKYRRLWMSFERSCIYTEIAFNENCRFIWLGKVIFVFRVLLLRLFPSLIFYGEILQQFDQIDHPLFYLPVIHCKIAKI